MKNTCYACELPATTVEHVPAKSFFPVGKRDNLITVPSCEAHNNDLAKDVEYVRNIVPLMMGTNATGINHLVSKVLPSYDHSPSLRSKTFQDLEPVEFGGLPAGIFTVDVQRLTRVMEGMFRALHYRDTGEKHAAWAIIPASMMHKPSTPPEQVETWTKLLSLFVQVALVPRPTGNADVFRYSSASNPSPVVGTCWFYELVFYDGFIVKGFTLLKPSPTIAAPIS